MNDANREHWDPVLRNLHWFMAALLVAQWIVGKLGHGMDASPAKIDVLVNGQTTFFFLRMPEE